MSYALQGEYLIQGVSQGIYGSILKAVILIIIISVSLLVFQVLTRKRFKNKQLRYLRVSEALEEKESSIKECFEESGIGYPPRRIFLRIFKEDRIVELWASRKIKGPFSFIKKYEISCLSGVLGPKRQEGDKQVPEGFYYIDKFNPLSKYCLALGLNYPNESDYILGLRGKLGGDIYIHGGICTTGCIPITDDSIKELYLTAVEAVSNGQDRIPVHIFPKVLDQEGLKELKHVFRDEPSLISFYENLKEGFDRFEQGKCLPQITVSMNGRYTFR